MTLRDKPPSAHSALTTTWVELKGAVLSEIWQIEKDKCCTISHMDTLK